MGDRRKSGIGLPDAQLFCPIGGRQRVASGKRRSVSAGAQPLVMLYAMAVALKGREEVILCALALRPFRARSDMNTFSSGGAARSRSPLATGYLLIALPGEEAITHQLDAITYHLSLVG